MWAEIKKYVELYIGVNMRHALSSLKLLLFLKLIGIIDLDKTAHECFFGEVFISKLHVWLQNYRALLLYLHIELISVYNI